MKILVTGASGLVGSAMVPFLTTAGHHVTKLVRSRSELKPNEMAWDIERGRLDPSELEGFDAVIHLAGENIGKGRWTNEKKRKIADSRVLGTRLLCQALASLKNPPKTLVSASATGYYGNRGDEYLTEQSLKGKGFLADVCEKWEEATDPALDKGIRVVNLRTGMVLSPKGGALKQVLPIFKWGLGGKFGSGKQYMSWIAIDDLVSAIAFVLQNGALKGPVNAVSPDSVTNETFTKILAQVMHRPAFMVVPSFMARLMFGEMADELLLSSQRVLPCKLEETGFKFAYEDLEKALKYLIT